jgi:hypothetical protein
MVANRAEAPPAPDAESELARPPNFRQEKKRREEAQKRRNQAKQQQKAARKQGDPLPGTEPTPDKYKNQDP